MRSNYNLDDLIKCWNKLNITKGDVVYVTGNLSYLGLYKTPKKILPDYYNTLINAIGKKGTIVFPTHSWTLVKSNKTFSPKHTPSETGVLTEYLRVQKGAYRQFHPFSSISAIGKYAKYITESKSKHANGPNSPFDKIIKLNAKFISIGLAPNLTCSQIHHIEFMLGVPYRFVKEFNVKIKKKKFFRERFYLSVCYSEIKDNHRDKNKKIFDNFKKKKKIYTHKLGKGNIYLYSINDFYKETMSLMENDIYIWLKKMPKIKKWI